MACMYKESDRLREPMHASCGEGNDFISTPTRMNSALKPCDSCYAHLSS